MNKQLFALAALLAACGFITACNKKEEKQAERRHEKHDKKDKNKKNKERKHKRDMREDNREFMMRK